MAFIKVNFQSPILPATPFLLTDQLQALEKLQTDQRHTVLLQYKILC